MQSHNPEHPPPYPRPRFAFSREVETFQAKFGRGESVALLELEGLLMASRGLCWKHNDHYTSKHQRALVRWC